MRASAVWVRIPLSALPVEAWVLTVPIGLPGNGQ